MAKFSIEFKKSVIKELRAIPASDVQKILAQIAKLAENPRAEGCIKLSGSERYRVRQWTYRILYEIADQKLIVFVVKVAHRSSVYRDN